MPADPATPDAPIVVTFAMSRRDWMVASVALAWRRLLLFTALASLPGEVLLSRRAGPTVAWLAGGAPLVAFALFVVISAVRAWVALRRHPDSYPVGPQRVEIAPEGVTFSAPGARSQLAWPFVHGLRRLGPWLVLWMGGGRGLVVPRRAFGDRSAERAFTAAVARWSASPAPVDPTPAASEEPPLAEARFQLDEEDFTALRRFVIREQTRRGWSVGVLAGGLMLVAVAAALASLMRGSDLGEAVFLLVVASMAAAVTVVPVVRLGTARWATRRAIRREPHRYSAAPRHVAVWPDRVVVTTTSSQSVVPWAMVQRVAEDGPRLYLFVDSHHAFVLRRDAFGDAGESLSQRLDLWRAGAPGPGVARGDPRRAMADPFAPPEE